MGSFLPNNYEVPQSGNYMKLVQGKNRFRVLDSAIVGNEFWRSKGEGREPIRRRMNEPILVNELEINPTTHEPEKIKHFWAFPVWNYAAKAVQILELTQKTVMQSIQALVDEPDWGDPTNYDIIVTRSGSGLDTEYSVQPAPAKPIDSQIATAQAATPINLDALFSGDDPFANSATTKSRATNPKQLQNGDAKSAAWKEFCVKTGALDKDGRVKAFTEAIAELLGPAADPRLMTAEQWQKLGAEIKASWDIVNGFPQHKRFREMPASPFSEEPEPDLADAPF